MLIVLLRVFAVGGLSLPEPVPFVRLPFAEGVIWFGQEVSDGGEEGEGEVEREEDFSAAN